MVRSALVALSLLAIPGAARAETEGAPETERYALRAEAGLEYDTNAHRTELVAGGDNPPLVASLLERLVLAATLSDVVADGQLLTLGATAAGKIFDAPAARDEDVAIAQSSLAWQESVGPRTTLTLAGGYYEAFQAQPANLIDASERRDFRSLAPTVKLDLLPSDALELTVSAGYRNFLFKPDRDEDFDATTAAVELRWARPPDDGADWEASTGASFEDRFFGGPAYTIDCPSDGVPLPAALACSGPDRRHDHFLLSHLEVTRTGRVLSGLGYGFSYNGSNSYGQTVLRHILTARFAAPLPGGLTLAARIDLSLAYYSQPQIIGQIAAGNTFSSFESIEDENRSSARFDLSREVGGGLRLLARYTFYANEIANGSAVSYRRQTMLLSLIGALDK
jgi:hypothetical protein